MRIRLKVSPTRNSSFNWEHNGARFRIGADAACDLALLYDRSGEVSPQHAEVVFSSSGVQLADLSSHRGTYLNRRRIRQPTTLSIGDKIRLGRSGPVLEVLALNGVKNPHGAQHPTAERRRNLLPSSLLSSSFAGLLSLANSARRWLVPLLGVVVLVTLVLGQWHLSQRNKQSPPAVPIETPPPVVESTLSSEEIYDATLQSAVWLFAEVGTNVFSAGSGWVADRDQRLVVTNFHVVDGSTKIEALFPEYTAAGEVIREREHYRRHGTPIEATIVAIKESADLALIQLRSLPGEAQPIALAAHSARPGQSAHTVGNPGVSGSLWNYASGTVRTCYHGRFETEGGYKIDAKVIETQIPSNQGDSGGPVVNVYGELIGVNQSHSKEGRLVSICIDVEEVRELLVDHLRSS